MKPERRVMSRREFLIAAGCGCAATLLVGSGCSRTGATTAAATVCPYGYRFDPWPGQCYRYVDSTGSGYCDFSEPLLTGTTQTGAAAATTTGVTSSTGATVLCDRHCQAPGQCARFVDSDNSGYCDLSEGVAAAQAATAAQATATPAATTAAGSGGTAPATATTAAGSGGTAPATATPAATATAAATATTAAVQLVQLCNRGCRTPGSCGRFTDSNGSGICDLYEGVPADQAASYGSPGSGRGGRGG